MLRTRPKRPKFGIVRRKLSTEIVIDIPKRSPLKLKFGQLAKFADGSCVGSIGSTSVLATAVSPENSSSTAQGKIFTFLTFFLMFFNRFLDILGTLLKYWRRFVRFFSYFRKFW